MLGNMTILASLLTWCPFFQIQAIKGIVFQFFLRNGLLEQPSNQYHKGYFCSVPIHPEVIVLYPLLKNYLHVMSYLIICRTSHYVQFLIQIVPYFQTLATSLISSVLASQMQIPDAILSSGRRASPNENTDFPFDLFYKASF
jgi:hypothetical protein